MRLMELIVSRENMMRAFRQVKANKGAPGIDKMTVEQLDDHLKGSWAYIKEELLSGRYRPSPVRGVDIPKLGGGVRTLGIPLQLLLWVPAQKERSRRGSGGAIPH
jgi:RNA-directed DNA polymerase